MSTRIGSLSVLGKMSTMAPRRANSPRCSTTFSRRYPKCTKLLHNSSISTVVPTEMRIGSVVVVPGASFCSSARVPATTTVGGVELRNCHMVRMRVPMVNTAGLTRSKGNVSHAGKCTTASEPKNAPRSSAISRAIVSVGVAMMMGRREFACVRAANVDARASSGTARTALRWPAMRSRPGSPAMTAANELSGASEVIVEVTARCIPALPWRYRWPEFSPRHRQQFRWQRRESCVLV